MQGPEDTIKDAEKPKEPESPDVPDAEKDKELEIPIKQVPMDGVCGGY